MVSTEEGIRRKEEMTDNVLPDELTGKLTALIKEMGDVCYHNHDFFRKHAEAIDQSDPFHKILQVSDRLDSALFQLLGNAYEIMGILAAILNRVATSIEKLPDRSEFDAVKEELQIAKSVIDEAVIPVKKTFEEGRLRGDDVYG
ncbi:MAG TPA: hypothetical protein VEH06_04460 [Candidatus Bathyarchaeia archaeon]|nr:hypothetical protein [Candidatus Bathyarchaeia archaeon]